MLRVARTKLSVLTTASLHAAQEAGLRYVGDEVPGATRLRKGTGFMYIGPNGKPIHDDKVLRRIRSLAIPPAWSEVWICPHPDGHLQARVLDAKGRKQYRYHPRWREVRDRNKYERMIGFGRALPLIRQRVQKDLARARLPREKILATVVRLLELTLIRVGNEEYAKRNDSFGLSSMRDRHVQVSGSRIRFEFRGKSGMIHAFDLKDRRLAEIVRQSQDLPGYELFQYVDASGWRQTIHSSDVNNYLQDIAGTDFTAKDFRTWAGTVLGARALHAFSSFDSQAQAKRNVLRAIEAVAKRLGNTKSICRKCYIHPDVLTSYMDGTLAQVFEQHAGHELQSKPHTLLSEEAAVLALLVRGFQRHRMGRP
jgi:DNA topoisomerase I